MPSKLLPCGVAIVEKGGVLRISEEILSCLKIGEGDRFIVTIEPGTNRLILHPMPGKTEALAKLRVKMKNIPGALGKVASILGEMGINIETLSLPPGEEYAEATIVVNIGKVDPRRIVERLKEEKVVVDAEIELF